jgi:uncharacterized protein
LPLLDNPSLLVWLIACVGLAAALYASVGHGGASAYLALMALFAVLPDAMRPTALVLNIIVASIGAVVYVRSGQFDWQVFWPFALIGVPAAFFAGRVDLPPEVYKPILGCVLVLAGLRYLVMPNLDLIKARIKPRIWIALPAGGALGTLAGLTGTGGGIFLSPLLVFMGWADARTATGIAALFIVVNSSAGLAGRLSSLQQLPAELPLLVGAAIVGAVIGTTANRRLFSPSILLRALGLVLLIAGAPLVIGL